MLRTTEADGRMEQMELLSTENFDYGSVEPEEPVGKLQHHPVVITQPTAELAALHEKRIEITQEKIGTCATGTLATTTTVGCIGAGVLTVVGLTTGNQPCFWGGIAMGATVCSAVATVGIGAVVAIGAVTKRIMG